MVDIFGIAHQHYQNEVFVESKATDSVANARLVAATEKRDALQTIMTNRREDGQIDYDLALELWRKFMVQIPNSENFSNKTRNLNVDARDLQQSTSASYWAWLEDWVIAYERAIGDGAARAFSDWIGQQPMQ